MQKNPQQAITGPPTILSAKIILSRGFPFPLIFLPFDANQKTV
jgi:hypothetical protein